MTGKRTGDFDKADSEAGIKEEDRKGYTWHHHQDVFVKNGKLYGWMVLVDSNVHDAVKHTGGFAVAKAFIKADPKLAIKDGYPTEK